VKLEFHAESFNIANPQYGQPNTDLNNRDPNTGFATISSTQQKSERQDAICATVVLLAIVHRPRRREPLRLGGGNRI